MFGEEEGSVLGWMRLFEEEEGVWGGGGLYPWAPLVIPVQAVPSMALAQDLTGR